MASATTTINVRIDKETKNLAQEILQEFGLDISTAIKAFFRKVIATNSIPFTFERRGEMNNPIFVAQLKKEVEWAEKHGKRYTPDQLVAKWKKDLAKSQLSNNS